MACWWREENRSAPEEGLYCKPKYRAHLFKYILLVLAILFFVSSAVRISLPSVFCILDILLIQVYKRFGTTHRFVAVVLQILIVLKPENPEKSPWSKDENQQQTQPTCDAGSDNRTQATAVGREPSHNCADLITVLVACVAGVQRGGRGKLNASAKRDESLTSSGVARIFQRGGGSHWSNNIVMTFSPRNIVGCLLKKRLTKGGHGHPRTPPSYALAEPPTIALRARIQLPPPFPLYTGHAGYCFSTV